MQIIYTIRLKRSFDLKKIMFAILHILHGSCAPDYYLGEDCMILIYKDCESRNTFITLCLLVGRHWLPNLSCWITFVRLQRLFKETRSSIM